MTTATASISIEALSTLLQNFEKVKDLPEEVTSLRMKISDECFATLNKERGEWKVNLTINQRNHWHD